MILPITIILAVATYLHLIRRYLRETDYRSAIAMTVLFWPIVAMAIAGYCTP